MRALFILLVTSFLFSYTAGFQLAVSVSCLRTGTFCAQDTGSTPVIRYAEWIGKNLRVQGKDFSDGATIVADGNELKSSNDENYPALFLLAKKAKKKVPRNQAIILQVRNPNGESSNEFDFYSGFVITLKNGYNGTVQRLNVGDRFLLFLPPEGDPPTLQWPVALGGTDQSSLTVLTRGMDNLPIPHAQGFFEVAHPGNVTLIAEADPLCPPLPPEYCGPRGISYGRFSMVIIVD